MTSSADAQDGHGIELCSDRRVVWRTDIERNGSAGIPRSAIR
jgi:hypothetical protein